MQHNIDWEIWLDCNISPIIAKWLQEHTNYIVKSSFILNLYGLSDEGIYNLAKENEKKIILISKDSDLPQLINRFGTPPKLINLQLGNTDNKVLFNFLLKNLPEALKSLIDDNASIVDLG
jgi:predicted nuclease of predicted toxin-antitoxin system